MINDVIKPRNISRDRFEFQFLKGVESGYIIEPKLKDLGYKVRYYMPFEIQKYEGVPYMIRRLIENPTLLWYGFKNLMQKFAA